MTITAAADGSSLGNPGPAGWAWYVDDETWHAGGWPQGTNNMGELMAVLDLLRQTAHRAEEPLHVLCDSQYVINTITKWMPGWKKKGWKKRDGKPVLNLDLVQAIDTEIAGREVTFEWVRGHAGHELNEAADARARAAATAFQSRRAPAPGPGFPGAGAATVADAALENEPEHPPASSLPIPAGDDELAPRSGPDAFSPETPEVSSAVDGDTAEAATRAPADEPAGAPDQGSLFVGDLELSLPVGDPCIDPVPQDAEGQCIALERRLLDPAVRRDPALAGELLAEEVTEIGASGRVLTRDDILGTLASTGERMPEPDGFRAAAVAPRAVLVTYVTQEERGTVQRSSLWVQEPGRDEAGPWLLRHHQGTVEA